MYDIPWPSAFMSFISTLRVFLVDVVSITKANCARPMNYYDSMMVVLVGTKVVLLLLVLGPWLWQKLRNSNFAWFARARERNLQEHVRAVEHGMVGRRRASIALEIRRSVTTLTARTKIDWLKVFRTSFMVLFVCYPGDVVSSRRRTVNFLVLMFQRRPLRHCLV